MRSLSRLMYAFRRKNNILTILFFGILSRVLMFIFIYLVSYIPDHISVDAETFQYQSVSDNFEMNEKNCKDIQQSSSYSILEECHPSSYISCFIKWDAVYFLNIVSKEGYYHNNEATKVFFPLYPFLTSITMKGMLYIINYNSFNDIHNTIHPNVGTIGNVSVSYQQLLVLSALLVSNVSFILAGVSLYCLTLNVFKHIYRKQVKNQDHEESELKGEEASDIALIATLLFYFSPASIFFTVPYSESLYVYLTFTGNTSPFLCFDTFSLLFVLCPTFLLE